MTRTAPAHGNTPSEAPSGSPEELVPPAAPSCPYVFLFYDDADRAWGRRVAAQLRDLEDARKPPTFAFMEVVAGRDTHAALSTSAANAAIAVVLVSSALLEDGFCRSVLLGSLLARASTTELALLPLALDEFQLPPHLSPLRFIEDPTRPLCDRSDAHSTIERLVERIEHLVGAENADLGMPREGLIELPDLAEPPVVADPDIEELRAVPPRQSVPWSRSPAMYVAVVGVTALGLAGVVLAGSSGKTRVSPPTEVVAPAPPMSSVFAVPPRPSLPPPVVVESHAAALSGQSGILSAPTPVAPRRDATVTDSAPLRRLMARVAGRPAPTELEGVGKGKGAPRLGRAARQAQAAALAGSSSGTVGPANEVCPSDAPGIIDHLCRQNFQREFAACRSHDDASEATCTAEATEGLAACCKRRM